MGFCKECKFIGVKLQTRQNNFKCLCEENARVNFITGELLYASCREKNFYGECLYFQKTEEDTPSEDGGDAPSINDTPESIPEQNGASEEENT